MGLTPGTRLGPYEVTAQIGQGGMGEVYRARDTKLGRDVAIKILPPLFTNDPDRLARFEREARMLAALNHPHIGAIYGVEDSDRVRALVLELVDGETLAECIQRGPVPIRDALTMARQIADALDAAHEKGIVHRDLKPANIKVTPAGVVKVLDFGLAKAAGGDASGQGVSQAMTVAGTREGVILGTAAYMSPEQARGKSVDKRTDIWAFGCVLYEMLTGRAAFARDTVSDTIAGILDREPQWDALPSATPPGVRRLLQRCFEKDAARRLRDAGEIRFAIEEVVGPLRGRAAHRTRFAAMAAGALGVVALGAALWVRGPAQPADDVSSIAPKPATFSPLTDQPGAEVYASLSPDGRSLVYQSRTAGQWDVYAQRVGGRNPVNVTADSMDDDTQPVFSPDGERIAFRSEREGGGIFVMGATGEDVKRLTDFGYNPAWSPDGSEIVVTTGWFLRPEDAGTSSSGQLFRVNIMTGGRRLITGKIDNPKQPHWSPHGDRVAYWQNTGGGQRDIWTVASSGGDPVSVTNDPWVDWNPVWSPDGRYLYFSSDRGGTMNLWRVRIDETSGRSLAAPEPVTTPSSSSGFVSFSRDGRQLAYVQLTRNWNVHKVAFDADRETTVGEPVPVTQGSREVAFPDISPDGEWIAFTSRLKPEDVFIVKADGTGLRQLTDDIDQDRVPRWSPDGKRIAFMSNRNGQWQVWTIRPDASGLEQLTDAPGTGALIPTWSPDGARLLAARTVGTSFLMQAGKPWKDQAPEPLQTTGSGARFTAWSWSANGRELAGHVLREDGSSDGIAVYSLESHTYERLAPVGDWAHWLPDNRRLLFHYQGKVYLIDSQSKRMREILSVAPYEVSWQFGVSRDGRQIVFTLDATEADVWQISLE